MKKKIILLILIFVFIYALGGIIFFKNNQKPKPNNVVKNLESIDNFNYTLKNNSTALYKKEFNLLKSNLDSSNINYEEYAKSIAKMFIIDLYSIKSKLNKYDVGGVEFIYPESLDNYKLNVQNTLYKYVEDNSMGKRNQELPNVAEIEVTEIKDNKYKISKDSYEGYKITLSWNYDKDLDYDSYGEVIIIRNDNILYITEYNPIEKKEA